MITIVDEADIVRPWSQLTMWSRLKELDLVTMRFSNVRTLLKVVGSKLINLTLLCMYSHKNRRNVQSKRKQKAFILASILPFN